MLTGQIEFFAVFNLKSTSCSVLMASLRMSVSTTCATSLVDHIARTQPVLARILFAASSSTHLYCTHLEYIFTSRTTFQVFHISRHGGYKKRRTTRNVYQSTSSQYPNYFFGSANSTSRAYSSRSSLSDLSIRTALPSMRVRIIPNERRLTGSGSKLCTFVL